MPEQERLRASSRQEQTPLAQKGMAATSRAASPAGANASDPGVCILIHGINGTPEDMDDLGATLEAQGFEPRNLLLPGHGTSVRDFARHGWDEWKQAVEQAVDDALCCQRRVIVIGHSLGAALALSVASERPRLSGVVALCPPVRLSESLTLAVAAVRRVTPYLPAWSEDIRDRKGARIRYRREVYRWTSTEALHTLMSALPRLRRQLPAITVPALIIAARHDHVVPVRDGREAYELISSERKELVVLHQSFHAVTKDVERHIVADHVSAFCRAEMPLE